jgi:hypothetical protein
MDTLNRPRPQDRNSPGQRAPARARKVPNRKGLKMAAFRVDAVLSDSVAITELKSKEQEGIEQTGGQILNFPFGGSPEKEKFKL